MKSKAEIRMEERVARWKELMKLNKEELLGKVSRVVRVHGLKLKDSKSDMVAVIVDAELPVIRSRR